MHFNYTPHFQNAKYVRLCKFFLRFFSKKIHKYCDLFNIQQFTRARENARTRILQMLTNHNKSSIAPWEGYEDLFTIN